jgi:hypothetical protein
VSDPKATEPATSDQAASPNKITGNDLVATTNETDCPRTDAPELPAVTVESVPEVAAETNPAPVADTALLPADGSIPPWLRRTEPVPEADSESDPAPATDTADGGVPPHSDGGSAPLTDADEKAIAELKSRKAQEKKRKAQEKKRKAQEKKRKEANRLANLRAKQSGEMARMPLQGKAALALINAEPSEPEPESVEPVPASVEPVPELVNDQLRHHADAIRDLLRRTVENAVEIGRRLIETKEMLVHRNLWVDWLEREFGMSERHARNFMNVYCELGGFLENFSKLNHLPVSGLYLLAAPSTSNSVRQEVIKRAEAGEEMSFDEVKSTIKANRRPSGHGSGRRATSRISNPAPPPQRERTVQEATRDVAEALRSFKPGMRRRIVERAFESLNDEWQYQNGEEE